MKTENIPRYVGYSFMWLIVGLLVYILLDGGPPPKLKFRPKPPELTIPPTMRLNYAHSIIPQGVESISELERFARTNADARKLYEGFDFESARFERLDGCMIGYVSYRTSKGVFYKQTASLICGDTLIVDDRGNVIRAKCGNRISTIPHTPVDTEDAPTDVDLETPAPPDIAEVTQTPSVLITTIPELPGDPEPPVGWLPPVCPDCGPYPPLKPPTTPTPEAPTLILTAFGAFWLAVLARQRKKAA